MSNKGTKARNRHKRKAMGYDSNPPRCETCKDLVSAMQAVPGKAVYRPAYCNVLGFPVKLWAVCDSWTSRTGETLEP